MPAVDPVAAPVAGPVGESVDGLLTFEVGTFERSTFERSTFNGSVAQPNARATPPIDMLEMLKVEQMISVRPVPAGLGCVAPGLVEAKGAAVLVPELAWELP
jgi:hypothetical protein